MKERKKDDVKIIAVYLLNNKDHYNIILYFKMRVLAMVLLAANFNTDLN